MIDHGPRRAYTVRVATVDDIRLLAEHRLALRAERRVLSHDDVDAFRSETAATYAELMAEGALLAWIAEHDGEIAGSVAAWLRRMLPQIGGGRPVEARVQSMYIRPADRRHGAGTLLLNALLDAMRERSVRRVYLHPSESGRRFYPAFGFADSDEMELFL